MDNLNDLLSQKKFNEPPEIKIIKDFIFNKYNETVSVRIEPNKTVILVTSSALANSIKMDIPQIQSACKSDKKIVIYPDQQTNK